MNLFGAHVVQRRQPARRAAGDGLRGGAFWGRDAQRINVKNTITGNALPEPLDNLAVFGHSQRSCNRKPTAYNIHSTLDVRATGRL